MCRGPPDRPLSEPQAAVRIANGRGNYRPPAIDLIWQIAQNRILPLPRPRTEACYGCGCGLLCDTNHALFITALSKAKMQQQDSTTGRERQRGNRKGRIRVRRPGQVLAGIAGIGYWVIRLIGATLRWEVEGWENHRSIVDAGKKIIYTFWHGRIFMATYFWRNRGIVVMTSQNRDGEYIARVIRRFGYGAARGSSSRGGRRALVEMIHEMRRSNDVAFTIDGPQGAALRSQARGCLDRGQDRQRDIPVPHLRPSRNGPSTAGTISRSRNPSHACLC